MSRHFFARIGATAIPAALVFACFAAPVSTQPVPPAQPTPPRPPAAAPAQPRQSIVIGYVEIEGDPRYEPITGSDRIVLKTREHPFVGAQIGIDEAAALVRVLNTEFKLERITVKLAAEVAGAVTAAADTRKVGPSGETGDPSGRTLRRSSKCSGRGFLHRTNELDTLGDDEPETPCHLNK